MSIHVCPNCGKAFEQADLLALPPPSKRKRTINTQKLAARQRMKARTGEHITIAMMAKSIKRSPRDCRAALRTLGVPKPPHGWSWPPSEAKVVEAKLRKKFGRSPQSSGHSPREVPIAAPPANDAHDDVSEQTPAKVAVGAH